ncbi:MAG: class I SAM-dependent methyltransferase [Halobacteriota archaeon]
MTKIPLLKLLIRQPFKVITNGLQALNEEQYPDQIRKKFRMEQLPTIDILDLFPDFREDLNTYSFLEGTSLVTDIMLLKSLARKFNPCSYLEIGSWRGESLVNVAEIADKCVAITLSEEEMREMKLSESFIRVHGIFSKENESIRMIYHNSQTFDFTQLNEKFDLIFVDGDHSYQGVLNDTKKVYDLRKNSRSVIVWHDYGFSTERVRYSVLSAILEGIPADKHQHLFHVSNTLCAVYVEGQKFKTYETKFPMVPDKVFSLQLQTRRI